jgi:hypothetical protein
MPGSWQPLNNPATFNLDAMLLLTDGSVMCHEYETPNWHKLTPDTASDYANGTWSTLSPMPNNAPAMQNGPADAPLYFASAVLRDGNVFCAGGEYNAGAQLDILTAEIYDPVTDVWTAIATPPGWTNIGDASSCVLPDGRVLLGNANTNAFPTATAIWDPESGSWSDGGNSLDNNSEEGWTLLPDGTVLAVQCTNIPNAQKYVIATNQWVSAGNTGPTLPGTPVVTPQGTIYEMGPQILLPDGRVFAIGASGHTALYTPPNTVPTDPGSWVPGPDFPVGASGQLMAAVDAPACPLRRRPDRCFRVFGPDGILRVQSRDASTDPGARARYRRDHRDLRHSPAAAADGTGHALRPLGQRGLRCTDLYPRRRSAAWLAAAYHPCGTASTSQRHLSPARASAKWPVAGLRLWRRPADGDQLPTGAPVGPARRRRRVLPYL